MRIVHVIPSLLKGGAERIVLNMCNQLHQMEGVDCVLITFRPDNAYAFLTEKIKWKVIPSVMIPSLKGKNIVEVDALQTFLDDFKPDVIHSHLFESEMVLSQIETSALRVVHFHDNMRQMKRIKWGEKMNKQSITELYERKIVVGRLKTQNAIAIAISEDNFEFVKQQLPDVIEKKILLNAIDTALFFHPVQTKKEQRIVMIGSLTPLKRQELAIRAIHELKKRGHKVSLDLVGNGIERKTLLTQIKNLDLSDTVMMHGNIDHPETLLKEASIYLHTSKSEGFGLVLIEAMASGLPVVCTNGGGNKILVQEGENGYLIEEQNPELIADKLELLLSDENLRLKMGRFAQEFSKSFDIVLYAQKLMDIYKS